MKLYACIIFILSLNFLIGCGKDDPAGPEDNSQMIISGKITGWNQGADKTIIFYNSSYPEEQYGKGTVSADGTFNFKAMPPAKLIKLAWIFSLDTDCWDSLKATQDANAQIGYLSVMKGDTLIGHVVKRFQSDTLYGARFIYVDKEASIIGAKECPFETGVTLYDLTFIKGWSLYYSILTPDDLYIKYTTIDPGKAFFYFQNK